MKAFILALAALAGVAFLGVVVESEILQTGSVTPIRIQVLGAIFAVLVAISLFWKRKIIEPPDAPQAQTQEPVAPLETAAAFIKKTPEMKERLARLETAAFIAQHAASLIDETWAGVGDKSLSATAYVENDFSREKFDKAEAALHEIYLSQLPDSEITALIVELRSHVVRAASLVEAMSRAEQIGRTVEEDAGRNSLASIRQQALGHSATIEAAFNRMRDEGK